MVENLSMRPQQAQATRIAPQLCLKCLHQLSQDGNAPLAVADSQSSNFGKMLVDDAEDADDVAYVGSTHWSASLDGLVKPKSGDSTQHSTEPGNDVFGNATAGEGFKVPHVTREPPRLLFAHHAHSSKAELLTALPERPVADSLVLTYFKHMLLSRS